MQLRRAPAPVVLAALALADLAVAHGDLNPTAPLALYTHTPAAMADARDGAGGRLYSVDYNEPGAGPRDLGRDVPYLLQRAPVGWDIRAAQALALREALFPPAPAQWGVEGSYDRDVAGLEPAPLALLKDAFRSLPIGEGRLRLLRAAAVTRVAALHERAGEGLVPLGRHEGYFAEPVLMFEVPRAVDRTYVVGRARGAVDDASAVRELLRGDFDPRSEIVLPGATAGTATSGFEGRSRVTDRRGDRVVIDAEANGPGWVVLVDAWDPGWRARVDGRPAALERANVAFRAVAIAAGRHEVELLFRPRGLGPALWASAVSIVLALSGAWITRGAER